jgi:copper oxidase (laccase) domain-containing protein
VPPSALSSPDRPFETFAPLTALPGIFHAFTQRTSADTRADDYEARLAASFGYRQFARAEQPHGNNIAVVSAPGAVPGVDALITNVPGLPLVVRCADCAAVYVVDPRTPAIGLAHSGKRGTLANIVAPLIAGMAKSFGTRPADCVAVVSPCIGPCHYEMDLWTGIETQLQVAGIGAIHNPRLCTACHLDRYFSYRAEKGQTGRLFALLALRE